MLSDHACFPILLSTDLAASRTFYHDVLGLEIVREDGDDRIVFRCGGGTQLALTHSTVGTKDTQTQMAWRVPDLRAALTDLRSRGVRIEEYEAPDPVTHDGIAKAGQAKFALEKLGAKKPAILTVNDEYGISGRDIITRALETAGVKPVEAVDEK